MSDPTLDVIALTFFLDEGLAVFARVVAVEGAIDEALAAWHEAGHPEPGPDTDPLYEELYDALDDARWWFRQSDDLTRLS